MSQREKWVQVLTIKRDVQAKVGDDLSHNFRSSHAYQSYTAMCGETLYAYHDGELDDEMVSLLAEYAQKVIVLKESEQA